MSTIFTPRPKQTLQEHVHGPKTKIPDKIDLPSDLDEFYEAMCVAFSKLELELKCELNVESKCTSPSNSPKKP